MRFPQGAEWLIILVLILLLFGAKRLPDMARSLGRSARILKSETKGLHDDSAGGETGAQPQTPALPAAQSPATSAPPAPPAAQPAPAPAPPAAQPAPGEGTPPGS